MKPRRLRSAQLDTGNTVVKSRHHSVQLRWSSLRERYECDCGYSTRYIPKMAGFWWDPAKWVWWTKNSKQALQLIRFADDKTKTRLAS